MFISIEFDEKEISMNDAFNIVQMAKEVIFKHDIIFGGRRFRVLVESTPLFDASYVVERAS